MVEAGVDFSSPANMHQFTFEVELQFAESPIPVEIVYVGDALGGDRFEGSSGGFGVDHQTREEMLQLVKLMVSRLKFIITNKNV